ncbi:OmpH family outer membrane protein [Variovorax sp. LT1P1]|uniref:OmpH family outer membrane protein n=1 Tax=Variovorax sp. LT1P1 TaxID=3443730 RepID=UPI003F44F7BF
MTHPYRVAGALLLSLLSSVAVHAQTPETFRIGFVNPDRVLREAQPAKAAQAKLETEFLKRERDVAALGEALKTASEKFEREAPTLPETQRTQRQRALVDQDREFQRRRREFQEDLNARKNEELQQVYDRANRVVRQVAEAEKYDAILQEAIYINPKHDITEKVIKALNAASSAPAAANGGK